MCTVTFLPVNNGYILTSSRDEKTSRPSALFPQKYIVNNEQLFYPKDNLAGGTWVLTSINNFTLCLLNGAFEKHESNPPYKMSRGLMLLDFFKFNDVGKFITEYNFENIENFTLIIVDSNNGLGLYELRWDGNILHHKTLNVKAPHIWSSCTLYTENAIKNRTDWFDEFIKKPAVFSKENILQFHKNAGDGSLENSIMMNRENRVKTVSITCIENSDYSYTMDYLNTENMANSTLRIFKVGTL
ncbi:MAG: NRDE family protein [Bacteroidia bacterium]